MSDAEALHTFLDKWQQRWPEWAVAEVFLPAAQRERAQAWLALRCELTEAAWGGDDPAPGAIKLEWWVDELQGWSHGARRHPLGLALRALPVDWQQLADGIPSLRASRIPALDRAAAVQGLQPFAQAVATVTAQLFEAPPSTAAADLAPSLLAEWVLRLPQRGVPAQGTDIPSLLALPPLRAGVRWERVHAALVRARLARVSEGQGGALSPLRALWVAWRAARG